MSDRLVLLSVVAILAAPGAARADDADRCATRAEQAQKDRRGGHLRAARDGLIVCASEACPRAVRSDCARWLSEVESELPTVVVRAVDARGRDLTDVRVLMDGEVLTSVVDGRPLAVDVGEHSFRFEYAGASPVATRIVVRSGERSRVVSATFRSVGPSEGPSRVGPFVLGGVGLALAATGAVLWAVGRGEHGDLESTCAPTGACATSDVDAARAKLVVGDVLMVGGVLALAGAVTWYLLASPSAPPESAGRALPGTFRF